MRGPNSDSRAGFTLMEVMVALSVMAVGLVAALELFSGSLRLAGGSASQTEAVVLARSLMDEVLWRADLDDGESRGREGTYRWQVSINPIDPQFGATEEEPVVEILSDEFELKEIVVTVAWTGLSGRKSITLQSARLMEAF